VPYYDNLSTCHRFLGQGFQRIEGGHRRRSTKDHRPLRIGSVPRPVYDSVLLL
jgi:hypothetical protein